MMAALLWDDDGVDSVLSVNITMIRTSATASALLLGIWIDNGINYDAIIAIKT